MRVSLRWSIPILNKDTRYIWGSSPGGGGSPNGRSVGLRDAFDGVLPENLPPGPLNIMYTGPAVSDGTGMSDPSPSSFNHTPPPTIFTIVLVLVLFLCILFPIPLDILALLWVAHLDYHK